MPQLLSHQVKAYRNEPGTHICVFTSVTSMFEVAWFAEVFDIEPHMT